MARASPPESGPTRSGIGSGEATLADDSIDGALAERGSFDADDVKDTQRAVLGGLFGHRLEPVRIGRFSVIEKLGAGAMGKVLLAFDPELDRKVALKLIRTKSGDHSATENRRQRLVREAKALAKLSHPNVTAVYEVGTVEDDVFIAMEYVEGDSLRAWMKHEPRHWRAVVEVFVQAGRGLAAAHDAGVIHRDFKPDNVIVGSDGRVRVVDFGLARLVADVAPEQPNEDGTASLTRTGTVMGTPAYMPPEQFASDEVTPGSDQFSFCVTLFEALHGKRPFSGKSYFSIAQKAVQGDIEEVAPDSAVPAWLRRIVRRGLQAKPTERYPSMAALLAELEKDPTVARWRLAWMAIGGVAFGLGILGVQMGLDHEHEVCSGAEAKLDGVWDEARRAATRSAFLATTLPYAEVAWHGVSQQIDAYARGWASMHEQACVATNVRHEQSAHVLDLRMECLRRRLSELDVLGALLVEADAAVVENAADLVAGLVALDRCADVGGLLEAVAPPEDPQTAAVVARLRAELARARALDDGGHTNEGVEIAREALAQAESIGYEPLAAEALMHHGVLLEAAGEYETSARDLREAYWSAMGLGHERVAAEAATKLVYVIGYRLARQDEGLEWGRHGFAAVRRVGLGGYEEGELHNVVGVVQQQQSRHAEAQASFERTLSLYEEAFGTQHVRVAAVLHNLALVDLERANFEDAQRHLERSAMLFEAGLGPDHPKLATVHQSMGRLLSEQGRYDEALERIDRAREIWAATHGPEHPLVAQALFNTGSVEFERGEIKRATEMFDRAYQLRERAHGPDHPAVAEALNGLAAVYFRLGRQEDAIAKLGRVLEIREQVFGPKHASVANALLNLGGAEVDRGNADAGLGHLTRALTIQEALFGPEHPTIAALLGNIGLALRRQGKLHDALAVHRRVLAIQERTLGVDHPATARTFKRIGAVLGSLGRHDEAVHVLERALASPGTERLPRRQQASIRFTLAKELWTEKAERERAVALAKDAAATFGTLGAPAQRELDGVERWLSSHGGAP